MNLDQVKTGDRLWAMRPSEYNSSSSLMLHEVIHLEHLKSSKDQDHACFDIEGHLVGASRCAVIYSGKVVDITCDRIHPTRDEAIRQAMKDTDTQIKALRTEYERYNEMLGKPPA